MNGAREFDEGIICDICASMYCTECWCLKKKKKFFCLIKLALLEIFKKGEK